MRLKFKKKKIHGPFIAYKIKLQKGGETWI